MRILLFSLSLVMSIDALALTTLKQINVDGGSRIDLLFDQDLDKKQIRTDFFRDIVQVSLKGVSIYPAKVMTLKGKHLRKIFAYQYTPKLVRCRLTVKGNAKEYKGKVVVETKGRVMTIRLASQSTDTISKASAAPANEDNIQGIEEKALFNRIMEEKDSKLLKVKKSVPDTKAAEQKEKRGARKADLKMGGKAPVSGIFKTFGMLTVVLLAMFACLWLLRKLKNAPGGVIAKKLGMSKLSEKLSKGKMIDVVASHYLGPKKSIAVVKISGKLIVLGITEDSINYLTQLSEGNLDAAGDLLLEELSNQSQNSPENSHRSDSEAVFSNILKKEGSLPEAKATARGSLRQDIRKRLEGMKPL